MKQNKKARRTQKQKQRPETLNERIHRHLSDINSEITDDDIRSVKTELGIRSDSGTANAGENATEVKTVEGNKRATPWDELSDRYD